ncbi:hypothetical protein Pmani_037012 [Petrolisthes manimaculis]|uniref:Uncharacterized protein n=1 Tax=Petrolisthes manimaculis TaxID=1843537 RepID=A0AAE1NIJ5_9EUCA|nr:hypothetical protein Pmani_037012 [Petrolisthes manimaculis]
MNGGGEGKVKEGDREDKGCLGSLSPAQSSYTSLDTHKGTGHEYQPTSSIRLYLYSWSRRIMLRIYKISTYQLLPKLCWPNPKDA